MKALYEITFNAKRPNDRDKISDTRRIFGSADTRGFMKVAEWAKSVEGDDEFVAGIQIVATEKP